ncbi:unnamed protein product [Paramecium primaurelia]|uniref:Uncharacterized protein n=1 Tax=Paramecium primaurelia TaxID=5886 RepID=A0A8S1LTG7_PARPR|nr:unnamed protein product [Paramecium primaurelia]
MFAINNIQNFQSTSLQLQLIQLYFWGICGIKQFEIRNNGLQRLRNISKEFQILQKFHLLQKFSTSIHEELIVFLIFYSYKRQFLENWEKSKEPDESSSTYFHHQQQANQQKRARGIKIEVQMNFLQYFQFLEYLDRIWRSL